MKKNSKILENFNKKYLIFSIIFIVIPFIIIIYLFSKSYALEGFGQLNLSCDKTLAMSGENITCTLTGTVSSSSQVSALSSQIKLSNNLEFVDFTTDSTWLGTGTNGNIQLYTENNKSETFNIGTFTINVKEGIVNTKENISLTDNFFYDEKFEEQTIVGTSIEILTPQFSSDAYDLDKEYILANSKKIPNIINDIYTTGCEVIVEKNNQAVTSGEIDATTKVKIVRNNTTIKEYDIVYIESSTYDLNNKYIITKNTTLQDISSNITTINAILSVKNNKLVVSYSNETVLTYDLVVVNSDKYNINTKDNYIIVDNEVSNDILNNITNSENSSLNIADNKLNITYNNEIIKTLDIISITSDKYKIDLTNSTIYTKTDTESKDIINNITTNANLNINENKLEITYNNVTYKLDIINISSTKYKLDTTSNYIYTKNTSDINTIKNNIKLTNATIEQQNDKILLKYNDTTLDEFTLSYITTNNTITDDTINLKEEMTYTDFINTITFNNVTYKIYDLNNNEITTGNINQSNTLKIYQGETLLDTYNIAIEYLQINNLDIYEDKKIIYRVDLNTTYTDLLKNIDTSGEITVQNKDGDNVSLSSKVKTSDEIIIKLTSKTVTYKLSVLGDMTGTGTATVGDVGKLYQYVKGKITMDDIYLLAGNVYNDDKIAVNDVGKLYQYIKGKLDSLK